MISNAIFQKRIFKSTKGDVPAVSFLCIFDVQLHKREIDVCIFLHIYIYIYIYIYINI